MGSAERMRQLLEPLGVYRWGEDSFQWAQLKAAGLGLDAAQAQLEEIQREMNLCTAEGLGLERICSLLAGRPATTDPAALRTALAALLRIQTGSVSLADINENLNGCGLIARAEELDDTGKVQVSFPMIPGVPDDFDAADAIIREIIPCHLEIVYYFWYLTWRQMERYMPGWWVLESYQFSWAQLEKFVRVGI